MTIALPQEMRFTISQIRESPLRRAFLWQLAVRSRCCQESRVNSGLSAGIARLVETILRKYSCAVQSYEPHP